MSCNRAARENARSVLGRDRDSGCDVIPLGATLTLSFERIVATAAGHRLERSRQIILDQIWSRTRLRFFWSNCCRSRFAWRRLRIVIRGLLSPSSFSFRVRLRHGVSACIDSLKSQSESSLLWRSWRCGQNINGLHPIAPPSSASIAISPSQRKKLTRRIDYFIRRARSGQC